jgi:hypothetical protein
MMDNKELDKLIKNCKTSAELHTLQINFANETIGRITDNQAMKILQKQKELLEKENNSKRSTNEKAI